MAATMTFRGRSSALNISAATAIAGAGRVARVSVVTAGSTAGAINDAATTGAAAAGNKIASISNTVGVYEIDFPFSAGLCVTPGTSQVLAVTYSTNYPSITTTTE